MDTKELDDRSYKLFFGIERSIRYHHHRWRFFESWNKMTVILALIFGSAAFTALWADLPEHLAGLPKYLSALIAIIGAIDLGVGTGQMANHHVDLSRQFSYLKIAFASGRSLSDAEYTETHAKRLEIEATENPPLRLLDTICHYEVLKSLGDSKYPNIPLWRRVTAHFFSQGSYARSFPG